MQRRDPYEIVYIYGLLDPRTLAVHYVGVSNNPKARAGVHWQLRRQHVDWSEDDRICLAEARKNHWLRDLDAAGLRPILEVWCQEVRIDAHWREKEIIRRLYREGEPVTNHLPRAERCQTSASCPDDKEV
jgi:hypothetical protein